ncbi:MAG: hypothetical protein KDE34_15810, partial [Anaerolineales bacterium]|nr:hypothetical protein [Anaerolineales bacterium]
MIIGLQAALNGVPGGWLGGHVLIFLVSPAWIYLGFLPRDDAIDDVAHRILRVVLLLAIAMAATAVYEVLFLFPQTSSLQEKIGISLYDLGFLSTAFSLLTTVAILAWRGYRAATTSYIRQQTRILLLFFALAILPTVLLTILPEIFLDNPWLPFPVAFS